MVSVSASPWRWWVLAHPVLTILIVVATANHWWLDGVVAVALLAAFRLLVPRAYALAAALPALSGRARLAPRARADRRRVAGAAGHLAAGRR